MKASGDFTPIVEGNILDLGDRPLEIIALPGHTPGSIAVLDINARVLISGDPIQDGMIFMFGVQREMHAYLKSLRKLDSYRSRFDTIYPSHGSFPVYPDLIDKLHDAGVKLLNGGYRSKETEFHGTIVDSYDVGVATFLIDKK